MLPLIVVLALAVHTLLPQLASIEAAAAVLRRLRWWAVAAAVAAQAASYWGNGYTIQAVARLTGDRLDIGTSIRIALAASSVGLITGGPVGYGAATYHWTRARGMSREGAMLCGWLPAVLNAAMLIGLSAIGVIFLLLRHAIGRTQLIVLGVLAAGLAAVVLAAAWVLASERRGARALAWLQRAWSRLRRRAPDPQASSEAIDRYVSARRLTWGGGWRHPLIGAVVNTGFDLLTLFSLFVAARHLVSPDVLIAGYGLPQLIGRLTFLPGGLAITEGGMVGVYAGFGVPTTTAVLVVLGYRALSFWLPTLLGFPLAAWLQRGARAAMPARALR